MRTKIIAGLLAILTALGGLNLFQSIKDRLTFNGMEVTATAETANESASKARFVYTGTASEVSGVVSETSNIPASVAPSASFEASDIMIEKTFSVREDGTLLVDVTHSELTVHTSDTREAKVVVRLDGRNMRKAREWFEEQNYDVRQDGDRVIVESRRERRNWNWNNTGGASIEIEIWLPEAFNLDVETSHGDVEVGTLRGSMELTTSHGDVELESVTGPFTRVRSSHGSIEASTIASPDVELVTSHAHIELDRVDSKSFRAVTSHSNVEIDWLAGDAVIETSHGAIEVVLANNTSADLTTSHGDVLLETVPNLDASMDLSGAKVRVSSDYDLSGTVRDERVNGRVGSGSADIEARTSHGTITVRPRRM